MRGTPITWRIFLAADFHRDALLDHECDSAAIGPDDMQSRADHPLEPPPETGTAVVEPRPQPFSVRINLPCRKTSVAAEVQNESRWRIFVRYVPRPRELAHGLCMPNTGLRSDHQASRLQCAKNLPHGERHVDGVV